MFRRDSSDQILDLNVTEGHHYGLLVTNVTQSFVLQVKHCSDPTWRDLPGFTGTAAPAVTTSFFCLSPNTRIRFNVAPSEPYHVSAVPHVFPTF